MPKSKRSPRPAVPKPDPALVNAHPQNNPADNGKSVSEEEVERRRQFYGNRSNFLKSAGPRFVDIWLSRSGLALIMKRVDLLDLARQGVFPQPVAARVAEYYMESEVPEDTDDMTPEQAEEHMQTLRALTCACIVQPPERYLNDGAVGIKDLRESECPPLFVMPDEDAGEGQLPIHVPEGETFEVEEDGETFEWRGLGIKDLHEIAVLAIRWGPGSMLAFRLKAESLEGVRDEQADGDTPEPDPGD